MRCDVPTIEWLQRVLREDENGCVHIMSRVDDLINVAGHRLSTATMEEVLAQHPAFAEGAVFGVAHSLKGEVPVGVFVRKQGFGDVSDEQIGREVAQMVRETIGAVASYRETILVDKLPKTRSGKILRRSLRNIYNAREVDMSNVPATIEDVDALHHFKDALFDKETCD